MEQSSDCRRNLLFSNCCCSCNKIFFFLAWFFFCLLLLGSQGTQGYKNYTVGDTLGWYDNLLEPKVNYQKWVAGKNFNLGDFLIFNTDKNHSVVQTYNVTTYRRCNYNDAEEDDTTEWSAGQPTVDDVTVTVAVPLVKEAMTYFFSGNYDGEQCKHGQHFRINVTHGEGLPANLLAADSPAPAIPGDDSTVPDTVVPSNFNNPTETVPDTVKASSGAGGGIMARFGRVDGGGSVVFALLWGLVCGF